MEVRYAFTSIFLGYASENSYFSRKFYSHVFKIDPAGAQNLPWVMSDDNDESPSW